MVAGDKALGTDGIECISGHIILGSELKHMGGWWYYILAYERIYGSLGGEAGGSRF